MKNTLVNPQLSCDIEIAFMNLDFQELIKLGKGILSSGYSYEDKKNLGWGAVLSKDDEIFGTNKDISDMALSFLKRFSGLINTIRKLYPNSPIVMRLGIYYETYSLTFLANEKLISFLYQLGIEMEISTYPSSA